MVSREVYGRRVCILRMLWVLSSFPRSERETRLLVDFAARPPHIFVLVLRACWLLPHVFAPALLAHPLLEAVAQDEQTLIPSSRTFCRSTVVIELECDDDISRINRASPFIYGALPRQRERVQDILTRLAESHAH